MDWIIENWIYIPVIMGVASVIVNFTPNETDNKYYAIVLKIVNAFAANFNVKGITNK